MDLNHAQPFITRLVSGRRLADCARAAIVVVAAGTNRRLVRTLDLIKKNASISKRSF